MSASDNTMPGLFYGYIIVICSFLIIMMAFAVNYSLGIFFNPIVAEFGWTNASTSAAYSIATPVGCLLVVYLFSTILGFSYGSMIGLQSVLGASMFGLASLGIIVGFITFMYTVGGALGPVFSGHIFDITRSYHFISISRSRS
jgi:hypothetical protein